MVRLREDGTDNRRNGFTGTVGHQRQQIPHEMHATPLPARPAQHLANRLLEPLVCIRDHQAHTPQAATDQTARERRPEGAVFRGSRIDAEHVPLPVGGHPNRHRRRLTDYTPVDSHLVVRRIHPDIGIFVGQLPRAKRLDHRVELLAHPRHLRLRDPVETQGLDQLIDLPRRHPVHVGFLNDGAQRLFGSPPTNSVPSASISAWASTRTPSRSTSPSCSCNNLPTNAGRSILGLAIRHLPSVCVLLPEELTERCAMAASLSSRSRLQYFHHVRGH